MTDEQLAELTANCENEALHLTGHIQPHGYMLVADSDTLTILAVSANIHALVGVSAERLLSTPLTSLSWLPESLLYNLGEAKGSRQHAWRRRVCDSEVHLRSVRGDSQVIVEIEPAVDSVTYPYQAADNIKLQPSVDEQWSEEDYWQHLLEGLLAIVPFERAVLYRFSEDFSGNVVAEHAPGQDNRYLGLKFPASDIPKIARQMYYENPSRLIADASEAPVPLLSATQDAVDLTWSDLRSVSPVHLEYLRNMGVATSYSIPIMISGNLWGLVSFHHAQQLTPDAQRRFNAEQTVKQFATIFATFLSKRKLTLLRDYDDQLSGIISQMTLMPSPEEANHFFLKQMVTWFSGSFAAIVINDRWYVSHTTPDRLDQCKRIDKAYRADVSDPVLSSQNITALPALKEITDTALRGMLCVRVNFERTAPRLYVFRPPETQLTHWAGQPGKTVKSDTGALSPRHSFEKWTQQKGEDCLPWTRSDELFAKKVRVAMIQLVNKQFDSWREDDESE